MSSAENTSLRLLEEAKRNVLAAEKLVHEERHTITGGFWNGHMRGMRWARIYAVRDALDAAILEETKATFHSDDGA